VSAQQCVPFEAFQLNKKDLLGAFEIPGLNWYIISFYRTWDPEKCKTKTVEDLERYKSMTYSEEAARLMCVETNAKKMKA